MEKRTRDPTDAERAEQEYRLMSSNTPIHPGPARQTAPAESAEVLAQRQFTVAALRDSRKLASEHPHACRRLPILIALQQERPGPDATG